VGNEYTTYGISVHRCILFGVHFLSSQTNVAHLLFEYFLCINLGEKAQCHNKTNFLC